MSESRAPRDANGPLVRAEALREHLANERTYLAWLRTSITVVGLGFVVGKFGVWLRFTGNTAGEPSSRPHGPSLALAVAMVILGASLTLTGAWRYQSVRRAIERGGHAAADRSVLVATVLGVGLALAILLALAISGR